MGYRKNTTYGYLLYPSNLIASQMLVYISQIVSGPIKNNRANKKIHICILEYIMQMLVFTIF